MNEKRDQHLSQISTAWTVLFQAHEGSGAGEEVKAARRQLLQQYGASVYRYLLASVCDPDVADELYQEFALKLVRGDFHRAHPDRGRFRDFIKTALYHLVVDSQRRRSRQPMELQPDDAALAAPPPAAGDEEFLATWKEELLAQAWEGLARWEQQSGQPLHTVLRFRADHPEMPSQEMATQLKARLGQAVTPGWVRKRLHQARERFTDWLVEEVARTLESPDRNSLEQELLDLGLLQQCRAAVQRRFDAANAPSPPC
jgi:RNA polymerase sigma-70 factor (ECF subfamily)